MQMRAARMYGYQQPLRVEEVPVPEIGPDEILVKVAAAGMCRSDYQLVDGYFKGPFPVTAIAVDVNGLKAVNDQLGHAAGDALLRRAGEVLGKAVEKPFQAARIGGDEFMVLLPGTDERGGETVMDSIRQLLEVNNQFYSGMPLSFAMGAATSQDGERLEAMLQRADAVMYAEKRAHYDDSQRSDV